MDTGSKEEELVKFVFYSIYIYRIVALGDEMNDSHSDLPYSLKKIVFGLSPMLNRLVEAGKQLTTWIRTTSQVASVAVHMQMKLEFRVQVL